MKNFEGGFIPGDHAGYQYHITKNFPGLCKIMNTESGQKILKEAIKVGGGTKSPNYKSPAPAHNRLFQAKPTIRKD